MPACSQMPRIICVSEETDLNFCRIARSASAISSSGTGWPSLYRWGSRISNRRCELLIGCRPLDKERDSLHRQGRQGLLGHHRFSRGPAFKRKTTAQETQGPAFRGSVRKVNDNHAIIVTIRCGKVKCGHYCGCN